MTILILHGIEGHAGIHWQRWLGDELVKNGHKVIMPDLPDSDRPDRKTWLKTVQEITNNIDPDDLAVVAHSLGAVTSLDLMEQSSVKFFIAVSGFAQDYGAELTGYFLKEKFIEFGKVNKNLGKAFAIYGDDDPYVPQSALEYLADSLGVKPEIIPDGGHFNTDAGYTTFPRLLEIIQKEI